jgi:uncharacterized protein (DUF1697 family)
MANHVALLRGINVGGNKLLAMADLRALWERLGFKEVSTLLQSGNVVFRSEGKTSQAIESLLEIEIEKRFGHTVPCLVRNSAELKKGVARNPFPKEAENDPSHLLVMFLKKEVKKNDVEALRAAIKGPEVLSASGRQLYIVYPAGIGTSKLTNSLIERKLGVSGTARNWNTVLKLATLLSD